MKRKTYWEQLQDPRWQKRRLELFEDRGWQCECCGEKTKQLHVHHRYYRRGMMAWDYPLSALNAFCEDCHLTQQDIMEMAHVNIADLGWTNLMSNLDRLHPEEAGVIQEVLDWVLLHPKERGDKIKLLGEFLSTTRPTETRIH